MSAPLKHEGSVSTPESATGLMRLYQGVMGLLSLFLPLWLRRRTRMGKEDGTRRPERFGHPTLARPKGPLIWMHGASVGECLMLLPLITRILDAYPHHHILLTSGTTTSADLMKTRLPERAFHQYIPADVARLAFRFLAHWKPDAVIFAESDIWPTLLRLSKKRGIPLILLNARMSARSIQRWKTRAPKTAAQIFGTFDLILAADSTTAQGLGDITKTPIPCLGNLKDAAPALPIDPDLQAKLSRIAGKRPIWCAASTHVGEEAILLRVVHILNERATQRSTEPPVLILAPRHPQRSTDICAMMTAQGFTYHQLSTPEASPPSQDTARCDIILMDTIGDMGTAFHTAQITIMGGSLRLGLTGHNPLEPARLGNAVISGPFVESFKALYTDMYNNKAARQVDPDSNSIAHMIEHFITTPDALTSMQVRAADFAQSRDHVLDDVWAALNPVLSPKDREA